MQALTFTCYGFSSIRKELRQCQSHEACKTNGANLFVAWKANGLGGKRRHFFDESVLRPTDHHLYFANGQPQGRESWGAKGILGMGFGACLMGMLRMLVVSFMISTTAGAMRYTSLFSNIMVHLDA